MKILQINKFYYPAGGADHSMLELSRALEERGHTVVPFAMQHPKNLPTEWSRFFPSFVETEQITSLVSMLKTLGRMLYSREAQKKLEELLAVFTPDVAHVHNIYHQLSPSILRTLAKHKIPIVMTVHDHKLVSPLYALIPEAATNIEHPLRHLATVLRARAFKNSFRASLAVVLETALHRGLNLYGNVQTYIVPSICMRDLLLRAGYPKSRIRVIPHGVELPPRSVHPRGEQFLFVGRLKSEKGCDLLLEAATKAPAMSIFIIGTGPDEEKMKAFVRDHGLTNVRFLGALPHERVLEEMRRARAVVAPSRTLEPFGLAALEALAAGAPVIAARIGALPEIVADQQTGLLFTPNDPDDLAAKLQWAAEHPESLAHFAECGRIVAEGHAVDKNLQSILQVYDDVQIHS